MYVDTPANCHTLHNNQTMARPTLSGLEYFEICKVRILEWLCSCWTVFFLVHSSLINVNSYSYPTPLAGDCGEKRESVSYHHTFLLPPLLLPSAFIIVHRIYVVGGANATPW